MTVRQHDGNIPHVKWIDLKGNNILVECAILKTDSLGNIYYIEIPNLDHIDKQRLSRLLRNRNAVNFELWDLCSQVTLNNGMNALEYFHQLVKVITPTGVIMNPKVGAIGVGSGEVDLKAAGEAQPGVKPIQDVVAAKTKKPIQDAVAATAK
jgi:hypothetical protein